MSKTQVIAVVGAGGKTTLIHALAAQYRAQGLRVLVTTSTHMRQEPGCIVGAAAEPILAALRTQGYALAGTAAPEEKLSALPSAVYDEVCAHADVVLVEADGSAGLPVKFPNEEEPVIAGNVTQIVVVASLRALGQPIERVAHRLPLVCACLGVSPDTALTAVHVQTLVRRGYLEPLRRAHPGMPVCVQVNAEDSLYARAAAALMAAEQDVQQLNPAWFAPQPQLIICGGGHVALALAAMAVLLELSVTVIDDRPAFADPARFPTGVRTYCDSFENLSDYLCPGAYYVVVTRGHTHDTACVRAILPTAYRYLGMMGSKTKVAATRQTLLAEGVSERAWQTLHAPIGLPIKAATPAEIAVSILAEIIAEKNREFAGSAPADVLAYRGAGVLCVITEKRGSAPRSVGSMMLVTPDAVLGTIGGGAVEYAAVQHARAMTAQEPDTQHYVLSNGDAAALGMVCGGSNTVLFIPVKG